MAKVVLSEILDERHCARLALTNLLTGETEEISCAPDVQSIAYAVRGFMMRNKLELGEVSFTVVLPEGSKDETDQ